ncbi:MAG: C39 family peptidase [Planctomycetaceae bacterium]|nr:C39 family peptidase [Planctomycetaceae bacterium]
MKRQWINIFFSLILVTVFTPICLAGEKDIPEARRMPRMRQPDNYTCGPTSAAMVLNYYGKQVSIGTMRSKCRTNYFSIPGTYITLIKTSEAGYTDPNHLRDALNEYIPVTKKEKASAQDIADAISGNKPVIVLVRSGILFHYYVIVGYKTDANGQVTHWKMIDTNGTEPQYIHRSTFEKSWNLSPCDYLTGSDSTRLKCSACKGDGKAWTKCVACSGTGWWSTTLFGRKMKTKCPTCSGRGRWSGPCPACLGQGKFRDFILDAAGLVIKPRTIFVPNNPAPAGTLR